MSKAPNKNAGNEVANRATAWDKFHEGLAEINKGWSISPKSIEELWKECGEAKDIGLFCLAIRTAMVKSLRSRGLGNLVVRQIDGALHVLDDQSALVWSDKERSRGLDVLGRALEVQRGIDPSQLETDEDRDHLKLTTEVTRRYVDAIRRERKRLVVDGQLRERLPAPIENQLTQQDGK